MGTKTPVKINFAVQNSIRNSMMWAPRKCGIFPADACTGRILQHVNPTMHTRQDNADRFRCAVVKAAWTTLRTCGFHYVLSMRSFRRPIYAQERFAHRHTMASGTTMGSRRSFCRTEACESTANELYEMDWFLFFICEMHKKL